MDDFASACRSLAALSAACLAFAGHAQPAAPGAAQSFPVLERSAPRPADAAAASDSDALLRGLIARALAGNPEIRAARAEREAALQRVAPAGALEDPMLEAGLLNVPTTSWRLNREDMTMKMLGLSQKLPWPGKRDLRRTLAAHEAQTLSHGASETANRVVRDVKLAYYELALALESARLVLENRRLAEQVLRIAEDRYAAGRGSQVEVLRAQSQLARMSEELLRAERERPVLEAELGRLAGGAEDAQGIAARLPAMHEAGLAFEGLREAALARRPQLLGLRAVLDRTATALELARRESDPDIEVRFSYGQREKMIDATRRPDMLSLTFALNIPLWRKDKLDPRRAEAQALRDQALSLYQAQQNETSARLRQQIAIASQARRSERVYRGALLPQAGLTFESALAAYSVGRAELPVLLEAQMVLFNYRASIAALAVGFNKALAEIEWLTGAPPAE